MVSLFHALRISAVSLLVLGAGAASGQIYPAKPVRIVTTDAGGSSDFLLRLLVQEISVPLGQPVVIDNRPGSGVIPGEVVSKAPPDGYTLLFFTSNFWITPLLQKTAYDPVRDFAPITLATRACSVLVVTPSLPVKSVKDLIALAKARPGELNYAHGSSGSASHLAGSMFKAMTGVNMLHIPYKGGAQAIADVMSGQAQVMFPNAATVSPFIKSGRVKALALTCAQPSALFPGLPVVGATVPGFESGSMNGLFAPAKTPEPIINRLNQETVRFLLSAATKRRLDDAGIEAVGSSPQEFAAVIKNEMVMWDKVIRATGIRAN